MVRNQGSRIAVSDRCLPRSRIRRARIALETREQGDAPLVVVDDITDEAINETAARDVLSVEFELVTNIRNSADHKELINQDCEAFDRVNEQSSRCHERSADQQERT